VYIYTVEAITNKGKAFVKQGNVTLIREHSERNYLSSLKKRLSQKGSLFLFLKSKIR
jgi:hypothetical protein